MRNSDENLNSSETFGRQSFARTVDSMCEMLSATLAITPASGVSAFWCKTAHVKVLQRGFRSYHRAGRGGGQQRRGGGKVDLLCRKLAGEENSRHQPSTSYQWLRRTLLHQPVHQPATNKWEQSGTHLRTNIPVCRYFLNS